MMIFEVLIEAFHLITKFLNIINDDEGITREFRQTEEEIVEVFALHRIDIEKIKIVILEGWDDSFRITPNRMNIFYFTVFKMLNRFDVSVPGIFYGGDGRTFFDCS